MNVLPALPILVEREVDIMRIGIACGGTGGHIFPGLAVAQVLKGRKHDVVLWLAGRDVESVSTSDWKGPIVSIGGQGLPSGISRRSLIAVWSLFCAIIKSWLKMRNLRPDVLLAMGGYGSVGPVMAAHFLGIPIVLHEANVIPGRAIEFLSKYAAVVAISFEDSKQYIEHKNLAFTGFPLRPDINEEIAEGLIATRHFTVLVMGGSQGAHLLNEVATSALCRLHLQGIPIQVIHLSGANDERMVKKTYENAGVPCVVLGFLKEMARAYSQADFIVARSGAATCAELVARRIPAVLIPLPTAIRNHQAANARAISMNKGAVVMEEKDLDPERLSEFIKECYRNPEILEKMKEALKNVSTNNAAERLADILEKEVRNKTA